MFREILCESRAHDLVVVDDPYSYRRSRHFVEADVGSLVGGCENCELSCVPLLDLNNRFSQPTKVCPEWTTASDCAL